MKQEFIEFLEKLMSENSELTASLMTDNIRCYIEALKDEEVTKEEITENGKTVLKQMQTAEVKVQKAKDIADSLGVSSRMVSGTIRKLVSDGFVEKIGKDPISYTLTEKGKNYIID